MKPKRIKALIVRDGKSEVQVIDQDLKTLQGLVGGYVECVNFGQGASLLVDEDGKAKGLPKNALGTTLCETRQIGLHPNDYIVGPMVVVGIPDDDGYFTDVPADVLELAGVRD